MCRYGGICRVILVSFYGRVFQREILHHVPYDSPPFQKTKNCCCGDRWFHSVAPNHLQAGGISHFWVCFFLPWWTEDTSSPYCNWWRMWSFFYDVQHWGLLPLSKIPQMMSDFSPLSLFCLKRVTLSTHGRTKLVKLPLGNTLGWI